MVTTFLGEFLDLILIYLKTNRELKSCSFTNFLLKRDYVFCLKVNTEIFENIYNTKSALPP